MKRRLPPTWIMLVVLIVSALVVLSLSASTNAQTSLTPTLTTQSSERFLTLPFLPSPNMQIQQAWTSSFDPNHRGIDYIKGSLDNSGTWQSFAVLAAADGEACGQVENSGSGCVSGLGNIVLIQHKIGNIIYYSYYGHLRSIASHIPLGDRRNRVRVKRGEVIGYAGDTGAPLGWVHLHFGFTTSTFQWLDPYDLNSTRDVYPNPSTTNGKTSGPNYFWTSNPPVYPDTRAITENFSFDQLDPRWFWIRETPTHWSLTEVPGFLRIVTEPKDIWQQNNSAPILLTTAIGEGFKIETKIRISPSENYQQGGLVAYSDDDNYVRLTYAYINDGEIPGVKGATFEFAKEVRANFQKIQTPAPVSDDFYLRIVKVGGNYYGYYSRNGENWILIGKHLNVNISIKQVGLLAFNATNVAQTAIPADFDYFRQSSLNKLYIPLTKR